MTEEKGLGDCMISSLLTHGRLWYGHTIRPVFAKYLRTKELLPLRNILYCSQREPDLFLIRFVPTSAVMG
jgi:hypothetical protein